MQPQCGTLGANGSNPVYVFAMDCFLESLGQEAANMGMRFLPRGGVVITGGGIPATLLDQIKAGKVLKAYLDQGPFRKIIENIPLYVSCKDDLGMAGVLEIAKRLVSTVTEETLNDHISTSYESVAKSFRDIAPRYDGYQKSPEYIYLPYSRCLLCISIFYHISYDRIGL